MHALRVFALSFFPVPRFDLLERTEFLAWLIQIGRRLAVLRGRHPASIYGFPSWFVDRCYNFKYLHWRGQPPTGARGWKPRIPADGVSPAKSGTGGCSRHFQAGQRIAARPRPYFHREIHQKCASFVWPFAGATAGLVRLRGNLSNGSRGAAEAVPPALEDREYSAGSRLLPLFVQVISRLFIMFQSVVRIPVLSTGTVGNLEVRACSMSGAVNRLPCSISEMTALIASDSLENPVVCASKSPRDFRICCNSSRFFWARLRADSATSSSFSIWFTKSASMLKSLLCNPASSVWPELIRIYIP